MEEALNAQVNFELFSSYLYLSMSSYFSSIGLNGFANWMRIQAQEELVHAMKFYDYIVERNGRAVLKAVDAPQESWKNPLEAFEQAYNHETKVTSRISDLISLSMDEKDFPTQNALQWFIKEQVEEEASAKEITDQIRLVDGRNDGLFMLDRELGQRVFVMPTDANA
jgi:ferritin